MTSQTVNFFTPGSESGAEFGQVQRNRALAQALMQSSFNPQQGQMVGQHYVPPSKLSYVNQMAQALLGGMMNRRADEQERGLAQQMQQRDAADVTNFLAAQRGRPAQTFPNAVPNDDEGNPMPVARREAVAPNPGQAIEVGMRSRNPMLQKMAEALMNRQMDDEELQSAIAAAAAAGPGAGSGPGSATGPGTSVAEGGSIPGVNAQAMALILSRNSRANKLGTMVQEATKPSWQNVNGNLVNTNAPGFKGGIQDSIFAGPDGRVTMVRANGGQPVVGAVDGSLDTYTAFENRKNRSQAEHTPGRPTILTGGRMGGQSQWQEINGSQPPAAATPTAPTPGYSSNGLVGGSAAAAATEQRFIMGRELSAAQQRLHEAQASGNAQAAALATQDIAGLQREIQRLPQQPGAQAAPAPAISGGGLDFSPDEKAAQAGVQARAVDTGKADVVRDTDVQKKAKSAGAMIAAADRALELLKQSPTASGLGEMVDRGAAFFGHSTPGAQVAAQLDIVAGDLVNNVPRMEGPQSDGDRLEYRTQAGRAADRNLPTAQRVSAMQEVKRLQSKYAPQNGGAPAASPSAPQLPAGWTVKAK